jgi:hypothetical protein
MGGFFNIKEGWVVFLMLKKGGGFLMLKKDRMVFLMLKKHTNVSFIFIFILFL